MLRAICSISPKINQATDSEQLVTRIVVNIIMRILNMKILHRNTLRVARKSPCYRSIMNVHFGYLDIIIIIFLVVLVIVFSTSDFYQMCYCCRKLDFLVES